MGLGRLLTRHAQRTGQEVRNAGSTFEMLLAKGSQDGQFPGNTYRGAMSIPAAWRASLILSDILGGVPWDAYRRTGPKVLEVIDPKPPLLEQPNPPDTGVTTWSSLALDLINEGNGIGLVATRNAYGWPTSMYAVPAGMVYARRITPNMWSTLPIGTIEYRVGQLTFGSDDVIHIKGPCAPGAVRGMGVLEYHLKTLALAHEQADQAGDIARHGVPTAVLKSENADLTAPEAQRLKDKWMESQRNRTVAVLNATTSFEALAWDPEEMQMMEARTFTNGEIALIYGIDASRLNAAQAGSSMTYTNLESDSIKLVRDGAGGHIARFEAELTRHFPRGTEVKANLDARLRADTKTRYESHQIGITAGFLLKNEARRLEDLPEIPGLDDKPKEVERPPIQATALVGAPVQELPAGNTERDQTPEGVAA